VSGVFWHIEVHGLVRSGPVFERSFSSPGSTSPREPQKEKGASGLYPTPPPPNFLPPGSSPFPSSPFRGSPKLPFPLSRFFPPSSLPAMFFAYFAPPSLVFSFRQNSLTPPEQSPGTFNSSPASFPSNGTFFCKVRLSLFLTSSPAVRPGGSLFETLSILVSPSLRYSSFFISYSFSPFPVHNQKIDAPLFFPPFWTIRPPPFRIFFT